MRSPLCRRLLRAVDRCLIGRIRFGARMVPARLALDPAKATSQQRPAPALPAVASHAPAHARRAASHRPSPAHIRPRQRRCRGRACRHAHEWRARRRSPPHLYADARRRSFGRSAARNRPAAAPASAPRPRRPPPAANTAPLSETAPASALRRTISSSSLSSPSSAARRMTPPAQSWQPSSPCSCAASQAAHLRCGKLRRSARNRGGEPIRDDGIGNPVGLALQRIVDGADDRLPLQR